jgi:ligand-binding SRPBCC domain-containing protein
VYFTAPLGFLGRLFEPWIIRPMLRRVFRYRQAAIARLFPSS